MDYPKWQSRQGEPHYERPVDDNSPDAMSDDELQAALSEVAQTRMEEGAFFEGREWEDSLRRELARRRPPDSPRISL